MISKLKIKREWCQMIICCIGSTIAAVLLVTRSAISPLNDSRRLLEYNGIDQSDKGCISRIHNLVYVHVPKTGGTTIELSPLFKDAGLHHPLGGHSSIRKMMEDSESRGLDNFVTAAHIRHPCDRFISAFYYLKDGKGNARNNAWAEEHIGKMNIDEYVQKQKENNWPDDYYAHFLPLSSFLFHLNGEFGIDQILCQEQWDEGIARLFSTVGMPTPDYLLNSSSENTNWRSHFLKNEHEKCVDLKSETRQAIEEHFAMDYCVFGYPSIPSNDPLSETCVGAHLTKLDFTRNYSICKAQNVA
jgi:hypothetical protein